MDFPGGSLGKVRSPDEMSTHSSILAWRSTDKGAWQATWLEWLSLSLPLIHYATSVMNLEDIVCNQSLCHTDHICKVSLQYGWTDDWWGLVYCWTSHHTHYICKVSSMNSLMNYEVWISIKDFATLNTFVRFLPVWILWWAARLPFRLNRWPLDYICKVCHHYERLMTHQIGFLD